MRSRSVRKAQSRLQLSNNHKRLQKLLSTDAEVFQNIYKNSAFRYQGLPHLLLEYGIPFSSSIKFPIVGKPKQCFQNCVNALFDYPDFYYCEGVATCNDLAIAVSHAWLVNDNSDVIDPTWESCQNCAYFGVVLNKDFVFETTKKTRYYGILNNDYLNNHYLLKNGFPLNALHSKFHKSMKF